MKFAKLVLRNALRNRRRAVLTVLSVGIAILTVSVLEGILEAMTGGADFADETRLIVREATAIIYPLPLAYRQKIQSVPGVRSVSTGNWFGGVYQDRKNFFAKFAVDAATYFPMYPEYGIAPEEMKEFLADRKGCIVGKKLAERYGFKVGGVIPIEGDIYPNPDGPWQFNVRGIYQATKKGTDESMLIFHWKYLDESRPKRSQGKVGFYIVQLDDASKAAAVARTIDADFENSPDRTLSETERAFATEFAKMMGNVGLLLRSIGGAVVFAILLVAANTMAMAARERTTEIAVMKTLGFPGRTIAGLVIAEGLLLTLAGWAVGMGLARLVSRGMESGFPAMFPLGLPQPPATIALALGIALVTGLVASAVPAVWSARIVVVEALRKVA